jgi:hypothetical protein
VKFLLDTNVLSEPLRPEPHPNVIAWLDATDEDRLYISVILIAELSHGISLLREGKKRRRLEDWLNHALRERFINRIIDLDQETAAIWGDVMAKARFNGWFLSPMDGFLAATALRHSLILVSRNEKDFIRTGVTLLNPWNPDR